MTDTYRWTDEMGRNLRASYHPEWSEQRPWVTYVNGTAGLHHATAGDAERYFKQHYRGVKPANRSDPNAVHRHEKPRP